MRQSAGDGSTLNDQKGWIASGNRAKAASAGIKQDGTEARIVWCHPSDRCYPGDCGYFRLAPASSQAWLCVKLEH